MGFEIDEYIIGKFFKHLKKSKKVNPEILERTVALSEIKPRLTILARALTGRAIEIFPAEREGGYKNNNFFLPISFGEFSTKEKNHSFYLFRILFLCVQQRLNLNWTFDEKEQLLLVSQQKALESSIQILKVLFKEFAIDEQFHSDAKQHFIEKATEKKRT